MTEPRPCPRPLLPMLAAASVVSLPYHWTASAGLPLGFAESLDAWPTPYGTTRLIAALPCPQALTRNPPAALPAEGSGAGYGSSRRPGGVWSR